MYNRLQKKIEWFEKNKFFSSLILIVLCVIGLGHFTDALDKIITIPKKYIKSEWFNAKLSVNFVPGDYIYEVGSESSNHVVKVNISATGTGKTVLLQKKVEIIEQHFYEDSYRKISDDEVYYKNNPEIIILSIHLDKTVLGKDERKATITLELEKSWLQFDTNYWHLLNKQKFGDILVRVFYSEKGGENYQDVRIPLYFVRKR